MRQQRRELYGGLVVTCMAAAVGFAAWSWPLATHISTHTLAIVGESHGSPAAPSTKKADWDLILANDQDLSLWNTAENARALLRGSGHDVVSQGQCYPMPLASTLGEHMIDSGLLASPWWLLTHDPVASYNLSLATALVIAAAGMFLFLHLPTGSVPAAVVGAIAFAFATPRLADLPYHPAVVGTHWIPWVLWSFERLLRASSVGAVASFAICLLLASLVGSYPLMAIGVFGATYGIVRIIGRWRDGQLRISSLGFVVLGALPAAAVVAVLLASYVHTQQTWVIAVHPDAKFLVSPREYFPGGMLPVGAVSLLGLIPLVLIRRDAARRIVPALAAATAVAFALATNLPLPGTTSSLYELLSKHIPILDSVRAPAKIGLAVGFGMQALGAIGWSRLLLGLGSRYATAIAAVLVLLTALEVSIPVARGALGSGAAIELRPVAPSPERIAAFQAALGDSRDRRAVLDLPFGRMVKAPAALVDAAYHGHPTSACYNSLVPPTMRAVYAMGARSHTQAGIEELAAAGFGFIVERSPPSSSLLAAAEFPPPARLIAMGSDVAIWGLPHPGVLQHDEAKLELTTAGGATRSDAFAPEPPYELDVDVTNRSDEMWALAKPAAPLFADVELASVDGQTVFRSRGRGVLPLALSPGATTRIQLVLPEGPPAGSYKANVSINLSGSARVMTPAEFHWTIEKKPEQVQVFANDPH